MDHKPNFDGKVAHTFVSKGRFLMMTVLTVVTGVSLSLTYIYGHGMHVKESKK
jgi:hypothetical protein